MLNQFKNFIHHLLNPHCEDCLIESECLTCNELRKQLAIVNQNNKELFAILAEKVNPTRSAEVVPVAIPTKPKTNWNQTRRELEAASMEEFRARKSAAKPDMNLTQKLEGELNASKIETTIELHEDGSGRED